MNIEEFEKSRGRALPLYDAAMHAKLTSANDKRIISEFNMMKAGVTKNMENYRYSDAAKKLYDFTWHRIADVHLEKNKERFKSGDEQAIAVLRHVYTAMLKLLHPFMPFITEAVYQKIPGWDKVPLIITSWP